MVFTVAAVIVDSDAFVDPRLDTSTHTIRDVLRMTAVNRDSFEVLEIVIAPQNEDEIRNTVREIIRRNSVDWIIVVGGIGFGSRDRTPEAIDPLIERPAVTIINGVLANVQNPYMIRPIAGVTGQSLIISTPREADELRSVLSYFTSSAPGFIGLLSLLKNERESLIQSPSSPRTLSTASEDKLSSSLGRFFNIGRNSASRSPSESSESKLSPPPRRSPPRPPSLPPTNALLDRVSTPPRLLDQLY